MNRRGVQKMCLYHDSQGVALDVNETGAILTGTGHAPVEQHVFQVMTKFNKHKRA